MALQKNAYNDHYVAKTWVLALISLDFLPQLEANRAKRREK